MCEHTDTLMLACPAHTHSHTHTLMSLVLQAGTLRLWSEQPRDQQQAEHHPIIAIQTSSTYTPNTDKVPVLLPAGTGGSKEGRGGGCGTGWRQPPESREAESSGAAAPAIAVQLGSAAPSLRPPSSQPLRCCFGPPPPLLAAAGRPPQGALPAPKLPALVLPST